jgi:transcriptional regulator with XRE-family HTH domain
VSRDWIPKTASAGVGDKIRFYRKEQNLTQEELADRAGVSIFTLRQYERGARSSPRTDQLIKLAHALNISVDDLLHTSDTNEDHSKEIGKRIRTERERRDISQKNLAEMAGIPVITLQQYERGITKRPRIDQLSKIAQALGLSVDDFLADENAKAGGVVYLSVSVSEIGRLLQSGEITISTSQQTIRITLSDK